MMSVVNAESPKDQFLNALSPVPTAIVNVKVSFASIRSISKELSTAAGTISAYSDPTVQKLVEQLTDNSKEANNLEVKILKAASELQWLSEKYVTIINEAESSNTFNAKMKGYLARKNSVFNPVDFATDLAYLGDQITSTLGELKSTVNSVEEVTTKLQEKLKDAKGKLDRAHSDAYTASVLTGVGQFCQAVCNAGSILNAAQAARAEKAKEAIEQDQAKVVAKKEEINKQVDHKEIPEDQVENAKKQYDPLGNGSERSKKIKAGAMKYVVGSALAQEIGAIFTMAAQLTTASSPDPDTLNNLQVMVDQLETQTLPIYQDHVLPALNLLDSKIILAKNKLLDISPIWITKALNTDTLDTNFAAWKSDGSWDEATFIAQMETRKKAWVDLAAAIDSLVVNPYSPPEFSTLMVSRPVARKNLRALASPANVISAVDQDATHALIEILSISSAPSPGSLTQSVNAINVHFSALLDEAGLYMDEPLQLSKQGNSLETSVSMLLSTVEYFASKIDSYLGKMEGKAAQALGALQRKLEAILEAIPAILAQIEATSGLCDSISQTFSQKIDLQEKALNTALKEFNEQKAQVQAIIDKEQRKHAEKNQGLGAAFKKMIRDGIFSRATLEFISKLLGIDLSDSSKLDDAKASLEAIDAAIEKANAEKQAYQDSRISLVGSQSSIAQLKIGLNLITPILQKKNDQLKEASKTIEESKIDWALFNLSTPNIVSGWKAWYNSLVTIPTPVLDGGNAVMALRSVAPVQMKAPLARAKIVKKKNLTRVFETPAVAPRSLVLMATTTTPAAAAANATAVDGPTYRAKIKEALAPAEAATKNAADIASDVLLIQGKLDDMLSQLASSSYAAGLVTKVANFKKDFNALEVEAKELATQIFWFADKNIKALQELARQADAGTLTPEKFQSIISYLQRKVATFVASSSDMTLKHKNLKTDMAVIEGALRTAKDELKDLIPKMQERLDNAKKDLEHEQDSMKKASILRAVGQSLSTLGQGGGLYAAVSGNAYVAGFAAAAILVGGILNLVGGLIDGDPNKITQLQATIDQLNLQIPDFEKAQKAMEPCIADSLVIQEALDRLSNAWQTVSNNLIYVNSDYKSWLAVGFILDDFLFDVDDNMAKWKKISDILKSFAGEDDGSQDIPVINNTLLRAYPIMAFARLAALQQDPYKVFQDKLATLKQNMGNTANLTSSFGQHVQSACASMTEANISSFLQKIQQEAIEAVSVSVKLENEVLNVITDATVLNGKLEQLIDVVNNNIHKVQDDINRYNNRSIWDRIGDAFSSFFGNIVHIGSGDFVDILKGLGSLASPIYGLTQGTIDSIQDAERYANQLRQTAVNLANQKNQLQNQIATCNGEKEAISEVRSSSQYLSDVLKLKLDVAPNQIWEDFLIDKSDIEADASKVLHSAATLTERAKK